MKIERSIGTGPRRGTEQTCTSVIEFVADILHGRGYPDVEQVSARFEELLPLLRLLVSTRRLAEPAFTVAMPDLDVDIVLSYDPEFQENLTPPNTVLLDKLTARDLIQIGVRSTEDVAKPLRDLPASVSTPSIQFTLAQSAGPAPQVDEPAADDARSDPDEAVPPPRRDDTLPSERDDASPYERNDPTPYDRDDAPRYDREDPYPHEKEDAYPYEPNDPSPYGRDDAPRYGGEDALPHEKDGAYPYERNDPTPYGRDDPFPHEKEDAYPYERNDPGPYDRDDAHPYDGGKPVPAAPPKTGDEE